MLLVSSRHKEELEKHNIPESETLQPKVWSKILKQGNKERRWQTNDTEKNITSRH